MTVKKMSQILAPYVTVLLFDRLTSYDSCANACPMSARNAATPATIAAPGTRTHGTDADDDDDDDDDNEEGMVEEELGTEDGEDGDAIFPPAMILSLAPLGPVLPIGFSPNQSDSEKSRLNNCAVGGAALCACSAPAEAHVAEKARR